MPSKIRFDIYTILIIALVPTFLAVAWGLTWNHDRTASRRACDYTGHYLTEVGDMASLYTDAGTLENTSTWLTKLEAINPSSPARNLHHAVVSAMNHAMTVEPELDTTKPAALYEQLTLFQQAIDNGRDDIVEQCPEFERLLSYAFPMFFREGDQ